MSNQSKRTDFAVLGMGRFGSSIVETLANYDVNILACDNDPERLSEVAEFATEAVQIDVSDERALGSLGLGNMDVVIVAMSEQFEASLIAAMIAKEQGAGFVMVKARSYRQKKILENVGIDRVVLPEREMGAKMAKQLVGMNIRDILEESDSYVIAEMEPFDEWIGKTVIESDIRKKHNMTLLGVHRENEFVIPVSPDFVIEKNDVLLTLKEQKSKSH